MFMLGQRNNINLPFDSVTQRREAYEFNNLQALLDIYYQGVNVLYVEHYFYELTWAYLQKCHNHNGIHVEPFLDRMVAVGLDSSEQGHPPEKFSQVLHTLDL
jgi:adenosine deaminase